MAVQFPNPNFVQDYEYVTPNGQTIRYTWDGEKWDTVGASDNLLTEIDDLTSDVDNNTGAINALDVRVTTNEANISTLDTRISTVEDTLINTPPSTGPGLSTREVARVEGVLSPGSFVLDLDVTDFCKSGLLMGVEVDKGAWITFYADKASRSRDASRSSEVDPAAGSGVLAEVITQEAGYQMLTPPVTTFNTEALVVPEIYLTLRGTSTTPLLPGPVSVMLVYLELEV